MALHYTLDHRVRGKMSYVHLDIRQYYSSLLESFVNRIYQHSHDHEGRDLLDITNSILNSSIIIPESTEEKREDNSRAGSLHNPRDDKILASFQAEIAAFKDNWINCYEG